MAVTNMAYDDPAYRARTFIPSSNAAGASAVHGRWSPMTSMLAKSLQITVTTQGTSATITTVAWIRIAAGGTALTTMGVTTMGTSSGAGFTTNVAIAAASQTVTAGDIIYVQNGTDATAVYAVTQELVITPGANVTL